MPAVMGFSFPFKTKQKNKSTNMWKRSNTKAVGQLYRDIKDHSGFKIFGCVLEVDGIRWWDNWDILQFSLHHFAACGVEAETFLFTQKSKIFVMGVFVFSMLPSHHFLSAHGHGQIWSFPQDARHWGKPVWAALSLVWPPHDRWWSTVT